MIQELHTHSHCSSFISNTDRLYYNSNTSYYTNLADGNLYYNAEVIVLHQEMELAGIN